ncbi:hypothetical protein Pcinc_012024 [Petrolisthes cinctipes]|uniref:Uncharacterized protein n=1 Tax=Petrolisthes cinctipes TaxID=88211 RepID=A0AAE1G063_PETCI|nr:hypothetical protein Pcinc_012024 [Petrolisthes cinctipes]
MCEMRDSSVCRGRHTELRQEARSTQPTLPGGNFGQTPRHHRLSHANLHARTQPPNQPSYSRPRHPCSQLVALTLTVFCFTPPTPNLPRLHPPFPRLAVRHQPSFPPTSTLLSPLLFQPSSSLLLFPAAGVNIHFLSNLL